MSVGTQLAAQGEEVELDGRPMRLIYSMRSMLMIEDKFGGVAALQTAISQDGTGKTFGPILQAVACGLLHEKDANGGPYTADRLADLIAPADLQTYSAAFMKALVAALPQRADAAGPDAEAVASPGASSTTSAPSSADGATPSSGA